jgi:hypothetical protein
MPDEYDVALDRLLAPRRAPARVATTPTVDPRLDSVVNDVIGEASRRSGFTYRLGEGVRTPEQQAQKVAQGVSWTMNSRHLHGRGRDVLAFDPKGNYITDGSHPAYKALGEVYAERSASLSVPVKWGVVNKQGQQIDPGHFELNDDAPLAPADEYDQALDQLLSSPAPPSVADPYESALDDLLGGDDEVVRVNSSRSVAPAVAPLPTPKSLNPYLSKDRAQRDLTASLESAPNASARLSVQLPLEYSKLTTREVAEMAARGYARSEGLPVEFATEWLAKHPEVNLYGQDGKPAELLDVLASPSFDEATRRLNVSAAFPKISQMKRDYEASKSLASRGVDALTSDRTTAGEKFGGGADLVTRPLGTLSTATAGLQRSVSTSIGALAGDEASQKVLDSDIYSPVNIVKATWERFKTGEAPEGFEQPIAQGLDLLYQKKNKIPLPAWRRAALEIIGDPMSYASLNLVGEGVRTLRGTKTVRRLLPRGLTVLDIDKAAHDGRYLVTLEDTKGAIHKVEAGVFSPAATYGSDAVTPEFLAVKDRLGRVDRVDRSTGEVIEDGGSALVDGQPVSKLLPYNPRLAQDLEKRIKKAERAAVEFERLGAAGSQLALEQAALAHDEIGRLRRAIKEIEGIDPATLPVVPPMGSGGRRIGGGHVLDAIGLPKSFLSSLDVSAPLRQGLILTATEPRFAASAMREQFRSFFSANAYKDVERWLVTHKDADLADALGFYRRTLAEKSGDVRKLDEAFPSRFAQEIFGIKHSSRAYNAYLDVLSMKSFSKYADELRAKGLTFVNNPEEFDAIARMVEAMSGRGRLRPALDKAAPVLNAVIFSPKTIASRVALLNPATYLKMPPQARRIAVRKMVEFAGVATATLYGAHLAGADVTLDPDSADFGKIRIGKTHYDVLGGFQQPLRLIAQVSDGLLKLSRGEKPKRGHDPLTVLARFGWTKAAPLAGYGISAVMGENVDGSEFDPTWDAARLFAPMVLQDMWEAYQEDGTVGAAKALPAFLGVGVQTYESPPDLSAIKPMLSAPVQAELDRLGLDLDHLGNTGKRSIGVDRGYTTGGVTGDSIAPFGEDKGERPPSGMRMDAEATAKGLSAELDQVLSELMDSPDYEAFTSDEGRRKFVEQTLLNIQRRMMNGVRRDARGLEQLKEQKVRERLNRMTTGTSSTTRFKL